MLSIYCMNQSEHYFLCDVTTLRRCIPGRFFQLWTISLVSTCVKVICVPYCFWGVYIVHIGLSCEQRSLQQNNKSLCLSYNQQIVRSTNVLVLYITSRNVEEKPLKVLYVKQHYPTAQDYSVEHAKSFLETFHHSNILLCFQYFWLLSLIKLYRWNALSSYYGNIRFLFFLKASIRSFSPTAKLFHWFVFCHNSKGEGWNFEQSTIPEHNQFTLNHNQNMSQKMLNV